MTDEMRDDPLRSAYADHLRARVDAAPAACVSPDALLALVRQEGPEVERLAVLDHVMACARCRREFDLLQAIEAAGREAERDAADVVPITLAANRTRPRQPAQHGRWRGAAGLALAASVVLAVGIARRRTHDELSPDVERGAAGGAADGVALVAPAGGTAVPRGVPIHLVWRSVSHATRYDVELLAPDGTVARTGATGDTTFAVTDASRLASGITYQWWVQAVTDDGRTPRRSAVRSLTVR